MTSTASESSALGGPELTIERLDEFCREFSFPSWGNVNVFYGGMHLTGFATADGDLLVFQSVVTMSSFLFVGVQREIASYAPAGTSLPSVSPGNMLDQLVENDQLFIHDDERVTCRITGVTLQLGGPREPVGPTPDLPPTTADIELLGEQATVPLALDGFAELDRAHQEELCLLEPHELLTARLAQPPWRRRTILPPDRLAERLGLRGRVVPVLECSAWLQQDWDAADFDNAASASPDLVAIVDALRERRPLGRLPRGTGPLAQIAAARLGEGSSPSLWGPAGSPLASLLR